MNNKNKKIRGIILIIVGIIWLAISLYFMWTKEKVHQKEFNLLNNNIEIKISTKQPEKIFNSIEDLINKYDMLIDDEKSNKDNNNLYYINNKLPLNTKLTLDKDLYKLISLGIDCYDKSNSLVAVVNPNYFSINEKDYSIIKTADFKIDLKTILNGYVIDQIVTTLENENIFVYSVKINNTIKVGSSSVKKGYYKITLTDQNKNIKYSTLKLNYLAVTTKSKAKKEDAINNISSLSVIALKGATADYLVALLYLVPINEGLAYVNDLEGIEAIWYDLNGTIHKSKGLYKYE